MNIKDKRGYTLIEVLIVITIIGIIFSVLSIIFFSSITNSLDLIENSEKLKRQAILFWDFQRKIGSAKEILLEKGELFMITTAGDYYEGVVKCAYISKGDSLFYYEFPYPYGNLKFYEENKLINLGKIKNFKILAVKDNINYEIFKGLPDYFYIEYEDKKIIVK